MIDVVIDEIVLRGLRPGQQYDFADALHRRLGSLIEDSIIDAGGWSDRQESSRRLAPVAIDGGSRSDLGDSVATAVYDFLRGGNGA